MSEMIIYIEYTDWKDFRYEELDSLLEMAGVDPSTAYTRNSEGADSPFLRIELPDVSTAVAVCRRSVLIKHIYELWSDSSDLDTCINTMKGKCSSGFFENFTTSDSWGLYFDAFRRTLSHEEKQSYVSELSFLSLPGPVKLKHPDVPVYLLLSYCRAEGKSGGDSPEKMDLQWSYIGRLIAIGGMREELKKYDLKKRFYLGPTSLDHALTLIMGNIAKIKPGSVVLDPFVGTASILVGATHFGGFCTGCDIDIRVLRGGMHAGVRTGGSEQQQSNKEVDGSQPSKFAGKGVPKKRKKTPDSVERSIWENFRRYSLPRPEIIRMDNHLFDRHCELSVASCRFDAIVTDPPYGIRAGAKKSGRRGPHLEIPDDRREDLIPCTQAYAVEEVMLDLLHVAAASLKMNGLLVYLIPTPYDFTINDLPMHPCLEITGLSMQGLSTRHSRHLVVMKKVRELTDEYRGEFAAYSEKVMKGEDSGFGLLIGKLQLALAPDGYTNEQVVKQASKSAIKRKDRRTKRFNLKQDKDRPRRDTDCDDGTHHVGTSDQIPDNECADTNV